MTHVPLFMAGLAALVVGASLLVRGASRIALALGVSPLVVGLTVVAFGTSSPEVAVSLGAALEGSTDIAIGNVVGSNIFNVLFILGISALVSPLTAHLQLIRQEVPIMIGVSLVLVALALDGVLARPDALLLITLLVAYNVFLIVQSRRSVQVAADGMGGTRLLEGWRGHWIVPLLSVAAGLALLVAGSGWLVTAASAFARQLGVSDVVIGLTIIAAGTSLPEAAASVAATLEGERDIAVGNVVGSNTFNILGCLGLSGLVAEGGLPVAPSVLNFDLWIMLAVALACVPVFLTGRAIERWEGAMFLGYYAAYTTYLILAAQQHDALPGFSRTMLFFVIPLTVVTLIAALIRSRGAGAGGSGVPEG